MSIYNNLNGVIVVGNNISASLLDFIKNRFQCESAVIEFKGGKKICRDELVAFMPKTEHDSDFAEIWIKKEPAEIYVINLSGWEKKYKISVEKYLGYTDILFHDVYTGMVYKSENGVIEITLEAYDAACINPNSLLYKTEYDI